MFGNECLAQVLTKSEMKCMGPLLKWHGIPGVIPGGKKHNIDHIL